MKNHHKKTRYLANICRTHLIAERNEKTHRGAAKGNGGEKQQRGTTKNSRGKEHHKKPRDAKSTQSHWEKNVSGNARTRDNSQKTTRKNHADACKRMVSPEKTRHNKAPQLTQTAQATQKAESLHKRPQQNKRHCQNRQQPRKSQERLIAKGRRERDLNPRGVSANTLSRRAP